MVTIDSDTDFELDRRALVFGASGEQGSSAIQGNLCLPKFYEVNDHYFSTLILSFAQDSLHLASRYTVQVDKCT